MNKRETLKQQNFGCPSFSRSTFTKVQRPFWWRSYFSMPVKRRLPQQKVHVEAVWQILAPPKKPRNATFTRIPEIMTERQEKQQEKQQEKGSIFCQLTIDLKHDRCQVMFLDGLGAL